MRDQMNCNQFNHAKRASKVYRIVGLNYDDGSVTIDVIKNRETGETGRKVVPFYAILGDIVIK